MYYYTDGWFGEHLKRMVSVLVSPQISLSGEIAIPAMWHIASPQRRGTSRSLLDVLAQGTSRLPTSRWLGSPGVAGIAVV